MSQASSAPTAEPLSLWQDTPTRRAILDFVAAVTDPSGPRYVPPEARIATFDNDGTLWSEKPFPFQLASIVAALAAKAAGEPDLRTRQPFQAALQRDYAWFGDDEPMLKFTGGAGLPALRLLVVHDDAEREFAYTAGAERVLITAAAQGWTQISVKDDWRQVLPA